MMKKIRCIDGTVLKLLAMALMLCDHIWAVGVLPWSWLTAVGRIAFPIFAFQIAEGMARTHDRRKYLQRMLLFALISEIPFNMMMGGAAFFPLHQNVMFTFLIAMLLIDWSEHIRAKHPQMPFWKELLVMAGLFVLGYVLGFACFVDYYGFGVAMVLLFWFTRDRKYGWAVQLLGMYYINWVQMGGQSYIWHLFGREIWVPQQGLALLALIPIWLYNGKRGRGGKAMQLFGYAFYPVHIVLLLLLAWLMQQLL